MEKQLVSVIIPIYKPNEEYLYQALKSVVEQTYRKLEILLMVDGDNTVSDRVVNSLKDGRIKSIVNSERGGLPYSLNRGIQLAKGEFICRMDSDDICRPERIQKQIAFLNTHIDYDMVVSYAQTFGTHSELYKSETNYRKLNAVMLVKNPIVHPTVIFRKSSIDKYNLRYTEGESEDYRLWVEMAYRYQCKIGVVPKVLLDYRIHEEQASTVKGEQVDKADIEILKSICGLLEVDLDDKEFDKLVRIRKKIKLDSLKADDYIQIYKKIIKKMPNNISKSYLFRRMLYRYLIGRMRR